MLVLNFTYCVNVSNFGTSYNLILLKFKSSSWSIPTWPLIYCTLQLKNDLLFRFTISLSGLNPVSLVMEGTTLPIESSIRLVLRWLYVNDTNDQT